MFSFQTLHPQHWTVNIILSFLMGMVILGKKIPIFVFCGFEMELIINDESIYSGSHGTFIATFCEDEQTIYLCHSQQWQSLFFRKNQDILVALNGYR